MKKSILTYFLLVVATNFYCQINRSTYVHAKATDLISVFQENGFLSAPDDITDLWLWLDGGDTTTIHTNTGCTSPITATGDRVACWEDKSPNGFNFTQTDSRAFPQILRDTFNGIANAVEFFPGPPGNQADWLEHDLIPAEEIANGDFTFFMVFRANEVELTNNAALFSSADGNIGNTWEMDFKSTDDQFRHTTTGGGVAFFDTNVLDIKLYTFTYDEATDDLLTYVDGKQKGSSTPPILRTEHMKLGINRQGSNVSNAQIAEVIAYDRKLGICEINEIILYLSIKYDQSSFEPIPVPGGVDCSQLFFWLRTDVGTSTTVDGTPLITWEDKAFSNKDMTQPNVAQRPIYRDNATDNINFHSVVDFDGINDHLQESTVIGGTNHLLTIYLVAKEDTRKNNEVVALKSSTSLLDRVYVESPNSLSLEAWHAGSGSPPELLTGVTTQVVGEPSIVRFTNDTLTNLQEIYINGALIASDATASYLTGLDSTFLGGLNNFYDGKIPEVLIYETTFTPVQIQNLDTYLAIKYGITLTHDYYDTDTNLIYDVSNGYANGIFGVGKDLITALNQPKSRSQNLNEPVTFELTTSIADVQFLVSGHDGGPLTRTTVAGDPNVLTRKWFAEMTGNVGTVNIELDLADIGANTTLAPANVKILIADNAALNNVHFIEATSVIGGIAYFEGIPLYDKYYTFSAAP